MKTRAITAFFFTIVMLGSIFLGAYTFTFFYLALSVLVLLEFYKLVKIAGIRPHRNIGVVAAVVIYLLTAGYHFYQFEVKYLLLSGNYQLTSINVQNLSNLIILDCKYYQFEILITVQKLRKNVYSYYIRINILLLVVHLNKTKTLMKVSM
jgi:CDP-diglyceride synthetase